MVISSNLVTVKTACGRVFFTLTMPTLLKNLCNSFNRDISFICYSTVNLTNTCQFFLDLVILILKHDSPSHKPLTNHGFYFWGLFSSVLPPGVVPGLFVIAPILSIIIERTTY